MKKKEKLNKISFIEAISKIRKAGIKATFLDKNDKINLEEIDTLDARIEKVLHFIKTRKHKPGNMIFLLMYDIENSKIRTQIAKYIIKEGCVRIQKSVYLAYLPRIKFKEIHTTLKEIQEMYENNDSILFIPVPSDSLNSMKILGQQIEFDFILENKTTLFF